MSAASCKQCGVQITAPRRRLYCSTECNHASTAARTRLRDDAKIKACPRCGGPKEPGKRRYCTSCRESLLPVWRQQEYERSVEKNRRQVEIRRLAGRSRIKRAGPDDTLRCAGCTEFLPKDKFSAAGAGKWNAYCKHCYSHYLHETNLRLKYGIDTVEYQRILDLQEGCCAICLKQPRKVRLAVDHDHRTGAVRGLLCSRCNHKLLGGANDSVSMLERAARYLETPPASTGVRPRDLPAWWEQRIEQAVDVAEQEHIRDPSQPPVAMIDHDGRPLAAMSAATFLGLLAQYEKATGVPLSVVAH